METEKREKHHRDIKLMFIGSVLPDKPKFRTPAFSRAGSMSQENLLLGLKHSGLSPSAIISYLQIQSFPGGKKLLIGSDNASLAENMPVVLLPFLNLTPFKQVMLGFFSLIKILQWGWEHRYDGRKVIYLFNITVPPGIFILVGARLIGAKAVVFLNDINIPGQTVPDTFYNKIDFFFHHLIIPMFDGHISVSDRIMDDFGPGKPYERVEGGVTDVMFEQTVKNDRIFSTDASVFSIVSVGKLSEENGIRLLLGAFSKLKGDDYRLHVAGSGPLVSEVLMAAQQDKRIIFYGFLSFEEVLSLYKKANVLVNLRLTKTIKTDYFFPSKMMEYLASGTPVISTCTGHIEREFKDIVFLLKDETSQGLFVLINQLKTLDKTVMAEKGKKARAYMIKYKTWDAQALRVVNYIDTVVLGSSR